MKRLLSRWTAPLLVLLASLLLVQPVRAEDEELDEVSRQVKEQMEKIIRLMRENEEALLKLSAGSEARTKPVDVVPPDVPPGQEGQTPPPGGEDGGRRAAEALGELVKRQRSTSGQIPKELEELVRLVPT